MNRCHACGGELSFTRHPLATGFHVRAWCDACRRGGGKGGACFVGKGRFSATELDEMPWHVSEHPDAADRCWRCERIGPVEYHHFAPRHLFDDADDWPVWPLCRACHEYWHDTTSTWGARR